MTTCGASPASTLVGDGDRRWGRWSRGKPAVSGSSWRPWRGACLLLKVEDVGEAETGSEGCGVARRRRSGRREERATGLVLLAIDEEVREEASMDREELSASGGREGGSGWVAGCAWVGEEGIWEDPKEEGD